MNITTVGIDLAKLVFQVHAVNDRGKMMLRKAFKRADLIKFFANLAPCLIGMEACGGALHCSKPHTRRGPRKRKPSLWHRPQF